MKQILHNHPGGQAFAAFLLLIGTVGGIEQNRLPLGLGIVLCVVLVTWFAVSAEGFIRKFERRYHR